jgi:hypothetical protein
MQLSLLPGRSLRVVRALASAAEAPLPSPVLVQAAEIDLLDPTADVTSLSRSHPALISTQRPIHSNRN